MATEIPIGVNELNRITELGGQLGVDAPNLLEFTETIALIGVTTTLSTEEAATGFARLDNIMQLGKGSFEEMGSTIVDLGNNFAATEDEILNFALRVAPIGATVGLTTDEVLAIATAFTSVGVRAERGGTAIQKTFIEIAEAAQNGGAELDTFAKVAGLTSDEFSKLAKTDPAAAFAAFVTGLSDIQEEGGNAFAVLDSLHLGNSRVVQSLLAMANAEGVLIDALDLAEDAWMDNLALTEEAEKRFETTASQLGILKNSLIDVGIAIGTELLPFVGDLAGGFGEILNWILELPTGVKIAITAITALIGIIALATAHPVILALVGVAGAIALIGRNARETAERVEIMQKNLAIGTSDRSDLEGLLGDDALKGLLGGGFKLSDIQKAIFGSEADYQEFLRLAKAEARIINEDLQGLTGDQDFAFAIEGQFGDPISKGAQEVTKRRVEVDRLRRQEAEIAAKRNRASILSIETQSTLEQKARAEAGRAAVQSIYRARRGLDAATGEVQDLSAAFIKDEFAEDVQDAMDTYAETVQEGFDEVEESIFSHLDAWYEFDEELEIAWDDIIATLNRQLDAVGNFNERLGELNLDPAVEAMVRSIVDTPGAMELFLARDEEAERIWIDGIVGVVDRGLTLVIEEWERKRGRIEFTSGQEFLASMEETVQAIKDDPDNTYNAAAIWKGLILSTLDHASPELKRKIIDTLIAAFGADSELVSTIDGTKGQIEDLILLLLDLAGIYTVRVETDIPGIPDNYVDWPVILRTPDSSDSHKASGGPVFANKPYHVGELGPELFVPFTSGTIIPNDKTSSGLPAHRQLL